MEKRGTGDGKGRWDRGIGGLGVGSREGVTGTNVRTRLTRTNLLIADINRTVSVDGANHRVDSIPAFTAIKISSDGSSNEIISVL